MKISAIIPCYNEEITIKQVIEDIRKYCNECEIYVFDNNSTDNLRQTICNCFLHLKFLLNNK